MLNDMSFDNLRALERSLNWFFNWYFHPLVGFPRNQFNETRWNEQNLAPNQCV